MRSSWPKPKATPQTQAETSTKARKQPNRSRPSASALRKRMAGGRGPHGRRHSDFHRNRAMESMTKTSFAPNIRALRRPGAKLSVPRLP